MPDFEPAALADMTAELVSAYLAHNHVPAADLPALIRSVHETLSTLGTAPAAEAPAEPLKPAVPVRKSVTDDYLVSLEDGKPYKTLKRHLAKLGLTPQAYREKWGLPADYPMVSPAYARQRSELARNIGLGAMRRKG